MTKNISPAKQAKALALVAEWMGRKGYGTWARCEECATCRSTDSNDTSACSAPILGPAPTGRDAAWSGMGPMLNPTWDWPSSPTPTILLEGGMEDWTLLVSDELSKEFAALGVFAEPYSSWALCLYPA